jgi:hypothetical protein
MPRGPKGERRPAVKVTRIATEDEPEHYGAGPQSEGKDPAAVALGRKGGQARAKSMSPKRRAQIAKKAARVRWK